MSQIFLDLPSRAASRRRAGADLVAALAELGALVPEGPLRFLIAGGLSSLLNWLARFPLSAAMPYPLAVGSAYAVGMIAGFFLYRSWVFPGSKLSLGSQVLRFVAVNLVGLSSVVAAAQVLVFVLHGLLGFGLPVAEAVGHGAAIVFGAVVNFIGHKAVTFARRSRGSDRPAV